LLCPPRILHPGPTHIKPLDLAVAVNISPQVLVDRGLTEHVVQALKLAGMPPSRLKLEVTESALMSDPVIARAVLLELDALGVEIAIDDFGTGYSSLSYLADLPVSEVKIDRSFVSRMAEGSSEKIIVTSTVDLAHNLGLRAVAEGVEKRALLRELKAVGCDAVQGYGIGRPLASDAATRWLLDFKGLTTPADPPQELRVPAVPSAAYRRPDAAERAIGLVA
jgi:EAL domain-containing protein (putative c-di-GMP-specific phosphodiesterase class I)